MMLGVFFLNIFIWKFHHIWSLASETTIISAVDFIDEYTCDSEKWPEAWASILLKWLILKLKLPE